MSAAATPATPATGSEGMPAIGKAATPGQLARFAAQAAADGRRLVVGALIADEQGRIYVQRRSEDRALFPGCWDLVGGHVEAGEDLMTALEREVLEETGWRLLGSGPVVEILDWSAGDGVARREIDLLVSVAGDLTKPYLEPGKHSEGRWLAQHELNVLLERRHKDDRWVHDTVERAFGLLAELPT